MNTIRALIADKDVIARHKLAAILDQESDIFCQAVSTNEPELIARLGQHTPDVLLLDLEDLGSGGLEVLARIRSVAPAIPIVVLVSKTQSGADLAIDALLDGAVDFVTKPENGVNMLFADRHLKKRLGPTVRMATGRTKHGSAQQSAVVGPDDTGVRNTAAFAVGGCSGAVPALHEIVAGLDRSGGHVLIAQHMPKYFTAALAERLSLMSERPVVEAREGTLLTSDRIWLAPGGYHIGVRVSGYDRRLHVHKGRRESGFRPSIDALFRSVADTFRSRSAAVVLSGCPVDGLRGSRAVREAGGRVLVQDPATAQVPDLPGAVISAGLASAVLAPHELAMVMNRSSSDKPRPRPVMDRAATFRNTVRDHDRKS